MTASCNNDGTCVYVHILQSWIMMLANYCQSDSRNGNMWTRNDQNANIFQIDAWQSRPRRHVVSIQVLIQLCIGRGWVQPLQPWVGWQSAARDMAREPSSSDNEWWAGIAHSHVCTVDIMRFHAMSIPKRIELAIVNYTDITSIINHQCWWLPRCKRSSSIAIINACTRIHQLWSNMVAYHQASFVLFLKK